MSPRPGSPTWQALQDATRRCLLSRNFAEYAAAWAEVQRIKRAALEAEAQGAGFASRRAA